jgi:glycine reductase complex component B subunit gamma
MTPVAVMVGANRIVPAAGIIHPLGNAELSPEDEHALRRRIVERALQALSTEVVRPTVFGGGPAAAAPDSAASGSPARASARPAAGSGSVAPASPAP